MCPNFDKLCETNLTKLWCYLSLIFSNDISTHSISMMQIILDLLFLNMFFNTYLSQGLKVSSGRYRITYFISIKSKNKLLDCLIQEHITQFDPYTGILGSGEDTSFRSHRFRNTLDTKVQKMNLEIWFREM